MTTSSKQPTKPNIFMASLERRPFIINGKKIMSIPGLTSGAGGDEYIVVDPNGPGNYAMAAYGSETRALNGVPSIPSIINRM